MDVARLDGEASAPARLAPAGGANLPRKEMSHNFLGVAVRATAGILLACTTIMAP
jgi:hypothetical protein